MGEKSNSVKSESLPEDEARKDAVEMQNIEAKDSIGYRSAEKAMEIVKEMRDVKDSLKDYKLDEVEFDKSIGEYAERVAYGIQKSFAGSVSINNITDNSIDRWNPPVFRNGEKLESIGGLHQKWEELFHSLYGKYGKGIYSYLSEALINERSIKEAEQTLSDEFSLMLEKKYQDIMKEVEDAIPLPPVESYPDYASWNTPSGRVKQIREILKRNYEFLESYAKEKENEKNRKYYELQAKYYRDLDAIVERKDRVVRPLILSEKKREGSEQEKEISPEQKQEALDSLQKEYLLGQVEAQTKYLKNLYAINTGLELADVESVASTEMGNIGGSVSMGISQSLQMRQVLTLEISQSPENALTLEMGDNLETIKKRTEMVNWVGPHEIAHLVDEATGVVEKMLFTEAGLKPVETLVKNWKGTNPELAREMLLMTVKKISIDAIGYHMVKKYGTADPAKESERERISAAITGYIATADVINRILQTKAESVEEKSRHSILLLRHIAVGELLRGYGKRGKVDKKILTQIDYETNGIRKVFDSFNGETHFVDDRQGPEIISLFKKCFKKAEVTSLEKNKIVT